MSLSQTLTWIDGGGATSFNVWFNGVFIGNQMGNSYSTGVLLNSTTYTWRIDSVNACGTTTGDSWIFTTTPLNALATDWAARVAANGGAVPSGATVSAISDFCDALDAASLTAAMIAVNCFAPDSLIASYTPLIVGAGLDPWTFYSFVLADLTTSGLVGNGTNKYIDSGVRSTDFLSAANMGMTLYGSVVSSVAGATDCGFTDSVGTSQCILRLNDGGNAIANSPSGNIGGVSVASAGAGYYSMNRVSTTDLRLFYAKSSSPHAQLGATYATLDTTAFAGPNDWLTLYVMFFKNTGAPYGPSFSSNRISFSAFHNGLSIAQSSVLYSAVQALRTALGGGHV